MTLLLDRYELGEQLGAGGMARVVAATDRRLGRRVAVKLIRDELLHDPSARLRLEREARAAASLDHPNTVRVFDVGEHDGTPFVVMELVPGHTLADELHRGRVGLDRTVHVVSAMLAGLQAAHERGLIHRDVKPGNVLLTPSGEVKLADFGIARGLAEAATSLTATGTVLGTPRYLAPEIAGGANATAASDLYAVGTVLYELLSGRPPFDGESPIAVALAHQRDPLPALPARAPEALAAICRRALRKDPEQRYASAAAMRTALVEAGRALQLPAALSASAGTGGAAAASRGTLDGENRARDDRSGTHDDHDKDQDLASRAEQAAPVSADVGDDEETFGGPSRVRPIVFGLASIALVLVAVAVAGGSGDDELGAPDVPDAAADAAEAANERGGGPPASTISDDDALEQLDELIDRIEREPERFGTSALDLRDDLADLAEATDLADRALDAREVMVDVAASVLEGELDRRRSRDVISVLATLGAPPFDQLAATYDAFVRIADDPRGTEPRTRELLDDLEDLLEETSSDAWRDDARDLLDRIDGWIAEREVRPPDVRDVRRALEQLAG